MKHLHDYHIFSLFHSSDLKHWERITPALPSFDGEAGFAASGSTVQISNGVYYFVSGGEKSRFFMSKDKGLTWIQSELPFKKSNASGAFSLAMKDTSNGIVVGGDYLAPNSRENVCFITKDGGITWNTSHQADECLSGKHRTLKLYGKPLCTSDLLESEQRRLHMYQL